MFLDLSILAAVYFLLLIRKWKNRGPDVILINTLMYLYLSVVFYFTLMPVITALPFVFDHPYVMHLEPFSDLIYGWGNAVREILLNILMTVPFGFLFPLTQKKGKRTLRRTVLCTCLLSIAIELLQPLLHGYRSCDITDVITNTFGGAIGYVLYGALYPFTSYVLGQIRGKRS